MRRRLIAAALGAMGTVALASSGGLASPPAGSDANSGSRKPLLTIPPPMTLPTAAVPAADTRRLPAWPEPADEPRAPHEAGEPDEPDEPAAPPVDDVGPHASSISCGSTNRGALYRPSELPAKGPGYLIPDPWRSRHLRYGTGELVGLIQRAAARVAESYPDAVLGVADLSDYDGGSIPRHRSHQSGRDVDLIFYATDEAGERMTPDQYMPWFNRRGQARYARQPVFERHIPLRTFDVEANWALARALLTDPHAQVERIFLSSRIKRWLLLHARRIGESDELIARASRVLHHPRRGDSHNDHMHVRILCSEDDARQGRCRPSSAPGRRRLRARVRCPHPRRVSAPDLVATDAPGSRAGQPARPGSNAGDDGSGDNDGHEDHDGRAGAGESAPTEPGVLGYDEAGDALPPPLPDDFAAPAEL